MKFYDETSTVHHADDKIGQAQEILAKLNIDAIFQQT